MYMVADMRCRKKLLRTEVADAPARALLVTRLGDLGIVKETVDEWI